MIYFVNQLTRILMEMVSWGDNHFQGQRNPAGPAEWCWELCVARQQGFLKDPPPAPPRALLPPSPKFLYSLPVKTTVSSASHHHCVHLLSMVLTGQGTPFSSSPLAKV